MNPQNTDVPICGLRDPATGGPCREARYRMPDGSLALRCEAHLGIDEPDEDAPFAGQRPQASIANQAREGMIQAVARSIEHLVERGVLVLPDGAAAQIAPRRAASVIIDDLAAEVLTRAVEGMAVGQVQPG